VALKSLVFWDIKPRGPMKVNQSFGGIHFLHLEDQILAKLENSVKQICSAKSKLD
jgi:hypothetical protein